MTPAAILETLHARGARLLIVDGNRLAVAPRTALDDELRQAIRAQKPALLLIAKGEIPPDSTPTPSPCPRCSGLIFWRSLGSHDLVCDRCSPCPDRFRASWYSAVTADDPLAELFDPDTRAACAWTARFRPAVVSELLTLERTAERLAESDDADAYHAAVAALVGYVRRLRDEFEARHA